MEDFIEEVKFESLIDTESDSLSIGAKFNIIDYEKDYSELIGYANIQLFNQYKVSSWNELIDNADSISGDIYEVMYVLSKSYDNEEIYGLIAVLDKIEIEKKFRGKGYCIRFVNKIIEHLEFLDTNYIALIPAKRTENGFVQNDKSVIDFYIKNGFKPLSRRVGGNVVMGKSLL